VKTFVKVLHPTGGGFYIMPTDGTLHLADLFDGADVGRTYKLQLVEMTQEAYDALPEFEGF